MSGHSRYKTALDLRRRGVMYKLADDDGNGEPLWMFVAELTSPERADARNAARLAQARTTMALTRENDSENVVMSAAFEAGTIQEAVDMVLNAGALERLSNAEREMRLDDKWKERLEQIESQDDLHGQSDPDRVDAEAEMIGQWFDEFKQDRKSRFEQMTAAERARLERMTPEVLKKEYLRVWIDVRGNQVATDEMLLVTGWLSARECNGVIVDPDTERWDHSRCNGHRARIWETKEEYLGQTDETKAQVLDAVRALDTPSELDVKK